MHIELIGSTSAGKTTLAKKMVEAGKSNGVSIALSDDFMLEQLDLSWVRNEFVRRRLVEAAAFAVCLTSLARHKDFFRFVVREGKSYPGSWFYKLNRIRNVLRKIGIFEFISRRAGSQQIILADNEGILQGVHNLFVHQSSQADLHKIARYAELVPMPDVILYLQQEEDVLISRTLGRGHARVAESSPDHVIHFIRQAVAVFDELINVPRIQERLLIVDGGWNILHKAGHSLHTNFHQVTELVRPGH
jgi:deoxyadenosine/deoxycytidine kinase